MVITGTMNAPGLTSSKEIRSGMTVQDLKLLTAKREYHMMMQYWNTSSSGSSSPKSNDSGNTSPMSSYSSSPTSVSSIYHTMSSTPPVDSMLASVYAKKSSPISSTAARPIAVPVASSARLNRNASVFTVSKSSPMSSSAPTLSEHSAMSHSFLYSRREKKKAFVEKTYTTNSGQQVYFMHGVVNAPMILDKKNAEDSGSVTALETPCRSPMSIA